MWTNTHTSLVAAALLAVACASMEDTEPDLLGQVDDDHAASWSDSLGDWSFYWQGEQADATDVALVPSQQQEHCPTTPPPAPPALGQAPVVRVYDGALDHDADAGEIEQRLNRQLAAILVRRLCTRCPVRFDPQFVFYDLVLV